MLILLDLLFISVSVTFFIIFLLYVVFLLINSFWFTIISLLLHIIVSMHKNKHDHEIFLFLFIKSSTLSFTDDFIIGFCAFGNLALKTLLNPSVYTSCVNSMQSFWKLIIFHFHSFPHLTHVSPLRWYDIYT